MRFSKAFALASLAFPGLLSVCLLGCGPDFDPPSELHTLRVLAVQKDKPYAQPGAKVNLQMLWEDASPNVGRPVTIAWSAPCFDPEGDLYYLCFTNKNLFGDMTSPGENTPRLGNTTQITVLDDIISSRTPPSQASNAPYGIAYVFFAACAGTLTAVAPTAQTSFPIGCKDADGNLLGSDDFVAGYTSVYSFDGFSNNNPAISGFEIAEKSLPIDAFCQDADCIAQASSSIPDPSTIDCDTGDDPRCIPTCAADGDRSCKGWSVHPVLDKTAKENQDTDEVSTKLVGRTLGEQMWINYYTDAGGFKSPVRLLNDATTGWNDDYGTDFYAPKNPGMVRIWGVVHDNRGGTSWAGTTLKVH
ncbi:MAG: hypothetical protein ABI548_21695 [Polyangiaceae bacterium]